MSQSNLQNLVEEMNKIAPKLREAISQVKEQAMRNSVWGNIRLYMGDSIQVLVSASPTGVVMLRICTRNIKNCIRLTRPEHLEEIARVIAIIGNSKAFEELKNILSENPSKKGTIDIAIF